MYPSMQRQMARFNILAAGGIIYIARAEEHGGPDNGPRISGGT